MLAMKIADFSEDISKNDRAKKHPILGSPREISDIMNGQWSNIPKCPIEAIRHSVDTIECDLENFLFVPELYARPNGPTARAVLLATHEAITKGATGIIATARPRNLDPNFPCLLVDSVSKAIRRLAEYRRQQSRAKFIAVSGSVGKSTTRNMIHMLTASAEPALRSIANYNDGMESVHFALANLSPEHRSCIVEFSEAVSLEERMTFYRPQVTIITNIMFEHMDRMERQGFYGENAIRQLAHQTAGTTRNMLPGGICILNADAEHFPVIKEEVQKSSGVDLKTFGRDRKNDVTILAITCDPLGSNIEIEVGGLQFRYRLGIPGIHMAMNSIAAATTAYFAGIDLESSLRLFETFKPESRRGTLYKIPWHEGHIVLRDETFSSSIPSLKSSLAQLEQEQPSKGGRRIAVLGQVNDIGSTVPTVMTALAREAEKMSIDRFYTIGSDIRIFNEAIKDRDKIGPHFQTLHRLEQSLKRDLRDGDIIVMKSTNEPPNISLRKLVDRLTSQILSPIQIAPETSRPSKKRVIIGGDTYFGEHYQQKRADKSELNYLRAFGYNYSGKQLAPLLQRADLTVVNLECALTETESSKLEGQKDYILRAEPKETIDALKTLNVGGVLLGNNHSMDYLAGGLLDTLDHVDRAGIAISGAGRSRQEAQKPILKEFDVEGIPFKLAILSGYEFNSYHEDMGFYAGVEKPGVNNINFDRLKKQIAELRSEGFYVIASPHWGQNYCFKDYEQSRLARRFIDVGADLILGHGSHIMNELQQIDGVWTIYGLGNLIFNSEGEYERHGKQPYSLVAELEFSRLGSTIEGYLNLYPIVSCNQLTQFQPTFVDEYQFDQVTEMLSTMHYDKASFFDDISLREIDGRHCMAIKVF
jgi:UDP-N-acetylmuramyl pentapeptide synthase